MIISHRHRFIFVKTAKTAGTSIELFLSRHCGDRDVITAFSVPEAGHHPRNQEGWFNPLPELLARIRTPGLRRPGMELTRKDYRLRRHYYHHLPAWQVRARTPRRTWNSYFKFCVERNPWDKVLSGWYWYQHRYQPISIDDYLTKLRRRIRRRLHGVGTYPYNLLNYTHPRTGEILVDRIIRFEELNQGLHEVLPPLGIPFEPPLAIRSKADIRPPRAGPQVLNPSQLDAIAEMFASEIELHGYSFDGIAGAGTLNRPNR